MKPFHRLPAIAFLLLAFAGLAAHANEQCNDNFTVEGSFLSGKTYKTWAVFPAARPQDAFTRAYAFTAANGFTVTNADKEAGVITAAQSVSYGKGKTVPLNIVVGTEAAGGVRVAMVYATSGGLVSPEAAIRKHFCMTLAAVGVPDGAGGAAPVQPSSAEAPPVAMPNPVRQLRGYASATPEQGAVIARELVKAVPAGPIRAAETEAEPALKEFIERLSCMVDSTGASAMNTYAAPGSNIANYLIAARPMSRTHYHAKSACLTVTRVQGWVAPAKNALRFEVVFTAEDSGEAVRTHQEFVRQPDGTWLATEVSVM